MYKPWDGDAPKFANFYRTLMSWMEIIDSIIFISFYMNWDDIMSWSITYTTILLMYYLVHEIIKCRIKVHASDSVGPAIDGDLLAHFVTFVIKMLLIMSALSYLSMNYMIAVIVVVVVWLACSVRG